MPNPTREGRPESTPVLLAWGPPWSESRDGFMGRVGLWIAGGAGLLLWTVLAYWLTA